MMCRQSLVSLALAVALLSGCPKFANATPGVGASKPPEMEAMAEGYNHHQELAGQGAELGVQLVVIAVDENGFTSHAIDMKRGSKSTLRFTRTSDNTCAKAVIFPELGLNKPLPINQPVDIPIPANEARTLTFQCGMGMFKSKVVVL